MRRRESTAVWLATLLSTSQLRADEGPQQRFWGGLGGGWSSDGSAGSASSNRNPLTASLWYPAGSIAFGYMTQYVGGHAFLSAGGVKGDETSGSFEEIGVGGDAQIAGPLFSVGARVDVGVAHASYRCKVCGVGAGFGALLLEPAAYVGTNLEEGRWSIEVHGGPRWKWIFGESDHPGSVAASPQIGSSFGLMLIRRF